MTPRPLPKLTTTMPQEERARARQLRRQMRAQVRADRKKRTGRA